MQLSFRVFFPNHTSLVFSATFDIRDVETSEEFPEFMEWLQKTQSIGQSFPFRRWENRWKSWISQKRFRPPTNDRRRYYRSEYLKSYHWNALKRKFLASHNFCQVCGSQGNLDVHHRRYRHLYDVEESDLAALCRRCHDHLHKQASKVDANGWLKETYTDYLLQQRIHAKKPANLGIKFKKSKPSSKSVEREYNLKRELERKENQGYLCVLPRFRLHLLTF